ncbi:MAG: DUF5696 domain-containing protein [Acholeplasmataceae bacterium]
MVKLKVLLIGILSIALGVGIVFAQGSERYDTTDHVRPTDALSIETNSRPEDTRLVTESMRPEDLSDYGFESVASSPRYTLYLNETTMNIALYDHSSDYVWTGFHPRIHEKDYTASVRQTIESGVSVTVFDATTLNEATFALTNPNAGTSIDYDRTSTGFTAHVVMEKLGLSFDVVVDLSDDRLTTTIPHDRIEEVPYKTPAMKVAKEYKVQSFALFPYFGSGNHEINGYAFVPDGSGALIRYDDTPYNSAYVKRIYGRDHGIQTRRNIPDHLKPETELSLPIFGINHGYRQAAFLAVMESGYGASELHSYPYMYNSIDINTTFFLYRTRDRALIELSGGDISTIPLINENPYPSDYRVSYTFLAGEDAGYTGMAKAYREGLELEQRDPERTSLHLDVIGIDFKHGLLGKQNVVLTTYDQAQDLTADLLASGVEHLVLGYESWNEGGFFGKDPTAVSPARPLGGKAGFNALSAMADENERMTLYLVIDPMVLNRQSWFQAVLKKTTLSLLEMPLENLEKTVGYYRNIDDMADVILDQAKGYQSFDIRTLGLRTVSSAAFSYYFKKETVYREDMIDGVVDEIDELDSYGLVFKRPNDYLFPHAKAYLDVPLRSNEYTFMTDSIPFISLVLKGSVELYSGHLNHASDLKLTTLRLIEYGISPSFVVTHAEGHLLRHTNYESLQSSSYRVWRKNILDVYQEVARALDPVAGQAMVSHRVVRNGISRIRYANDVVIYVNYNTESITYDGAVLPALSATVVRP